MRWRFQSEPSRQSIGQARVLGTPQPLGDSRLVVTLVVSIVLHGLVLSTHFGQRVDSASSPQEQFAPKLIVMILPSGISKGISPNGALEDHQVGGMTPPPIHAHRSRVSRHADQHHASDIDSKSEKPDAPANDRSISPSPSIDIDAAREIARQFGRESPGPSNQRARPDTPAMERETALGTNIAKAARPDCRDAQFNKSEIGGGFTFSATGLFAIPYLVNGAVAERGCKW